MGERRALREEAIARMDGLGAGLKACGYDLIDRQIRKGGGGGAYRDGVVSHIDVQRVLIGFGIDGDGPNAHATRRLNDTTGDFAPVGYQDCLEHRALARKAPRFPSVVVSIGTTEAGKQPRSGRFG